MGPANGRAPCGQHGSTGALTCEKSPAQDGDKLRSPHDE